MTTRSARTTLVVLAALLGGVWLSGGAAVASAHVSIHGDGVAAGSSAVLTLSVPHGCEGAATTRVAVQVPAGITEVTPTVEPGWTVHKSLAHLREPLVLPDGDEVTERVDQVVYTAKTPLPDGYRARFELEVAIPVEAAGTTLSFPTVQTCTEGEVAWTQVPARGQDSEELQSPAPSVVVAPAAAGTGSAAAAAVAEDGGTPPGSAAARPGPGWGLAGFVVGLAGLAAGTTALLRGSTRPR